MLLSQAISTGKLLVGKERSPAMLPAAPAAVCPPPWSSPSPLGSLCPGSLHLFPPPASLRAQRDTELIEYVSVVCHVNKLPFAISGRVSR